MSVKSKTISGFTLIEAIVVMAVLAILAGTLVPLSNRTIAASKILKVRNELRDIQEALDFYFYDNASFPSSLTDATFLGPYLNPGIDNEAISDDLSGTPGDTYQIGFETYSTGVSRNCVVWSVGLDQADSSTTAGGHPISLIQALDSDDIHVYSRSAISGRRKTRQRMDLIGAALCKYYWDPAYATPNTMTAVADWSSDSTTRAALLLLQEFDTDGFGNGFINTAPPATGNAYDTPTIYSKGPDRADDSGSDDDILF